MAERVGFELKLEFPTCNPRRVRKLQKQKYSRENFANPPSGHKSLVWFRFSFLSIWKGEHQAILWLKVVTRKPDWVCMRLPAQRVVQAICEAWRNELLLVNSRRAACSVTAICGGELILGIAA